MTVDDRPGKAAEWYCPYTKTIVSHPRRGFLSRVCEQGHRVVLLEQPYVSSDIAALGGIAAAMMFSAAFLWVGGYLIYFGSSWWKVAAGYALAVAGFGLPFYEAVISILLGRACKNTEGLSSVIGWVNMAKGAGILTGSGLVLICVIYLIASDTVRFVYSAMR